MARRFQVIFGGGDARRQWLKRESKSGLDMSSSFRVNRVAIYTPVTRLALDPPRHVYRLHTMHSREIIKRLESNGWAKVAQTGDHVQFKHPTKPGRVTVVHPRKDCPIGTLKSIERQSGIKLR